MNPTTSMKPPSPPTQPETVEFCPTDRLVPDFDFNEFPDFDFDFDEKLFEGSSIDALLEDLPSASAPVVDENFNSFDQLAMPYDDEMPSFISMHCDGKKELDLMEMISQVNL